MPVALQALAAVTPATSLFAAFGLAGSGYLTGREDIAACGALAGALGLVVERIQTRSVRVRLRRERSRHRGDVQEVSRLLQEVHRDLAGLRLDLDEVRAERDEVRAELASTREKLETAHPISPLLPHQIRSPIATGGIPILAPGPRESVRTSDPRSARSAQNGETQPIPVMSAERSDALVYAAMAQADVAELTRMLQAPALTKGHADAFHTGDAHHAGDYPREQAPPADGAPMLYIVRRGKHAA